MVEPVSECKGSANPRKSETKAQIFCVTLSSVVKPDRRKNKTEQQELCCQVTCGKAGRASTPRARIGNWQTGRTPPQKNKVGLCLDKVRP